jgi:predicted negative regulator of RcsB-dependent stress response
MKTMRFNSRGIAHLAFLILVVVVAVVGVVGWRVMDSNKVVPTATKAVPTTLTSKKDVTKAATELDATDVDGSLNPDQLNSDLNSLL